MRGMEIGTDGEDWERMRWYKKATLKSRFNRDYRTEAGINWQYPKFCVNVNSGRDFSRELNPDSVFKDSHKLVHHQPPISDRHCPFLLNLL